MKICSQLKGITGPVCIMGSSSGSNVLCSQGHMWHMLHVRMFCSIYSLTVLNPSIHLFSPLNISTFTQSFETQTASETGNSDDDSEVDYQPLNDSQ